VQKRKPKNWGKGGTFSAFSLDKRHEMC
jgi:hypothetical protein